MDTTPRYAVVHHRAITPDGCAHKRISIHRRYTHAIAMPCPDDPQKWFIQSWHTSEHTALRSATLPDAHIVTVSRSEQTHTDEVLAA